ncbi:MAG: Uma2 family endonuclease [Pyrinomonadaceae bacterium]|nr:Uma2 family endonuclease [Pyrinomonadaceae bacterium]
MPQTLSNLDCKTIELIENLITENDEPLDSLFSAKQQRLLVEPLYSSWKPIDVETSEGRKFFADSNIGLFFSVHQPPLVPDMFLSLDVETPANLDLNAHRSYFVWEFGKVPDVAVEIVSNRKGNELTSKLKDYARIGVTYYVVFDPFKSLGESVLQVYEPGFGRCLRPKSDSILNEVGLEVRLWRGEFEGISGEWLRWYDSEGNLILTGKESAEKMVRKLRDLGIEF